MIYPKYYGQYLGIVVQNNDPLKRGRVKVFVPHITPTVYKNWNEVYNDKRFKFLGKNVGSDLNEALAELKKILPWAEISAPLVGESSSGRYNAYLNTGTISDSSNVKKTFSSTDNSDIDTSKLTQYNQNLDNIGEKPGNLFDISYYKLKDAFSDPVETNANNANKYSYNYTPECYSNCARGSFPILNVGAHVWVFFNSGDPLKPVIFGSSYGSEDWKGILGIPTSNSVGLSGTPDQGIDYPGAYENTANDPNTEYDVNTETYRNKYVINQKGGTIAFINTDNREALKLTHYSGSFKEFNNFTNIELASNNDQKLVLNDQFLTVRGTRNEFTELDYDFITRGDIYKKVGNLNRALHLQWKNIVSEIADVKQLFDIQRAEAITTSNGIKLTSTLQTKSNGTPDKCPVCNKSTNQYFTVNNSYSPEFKADLFPSLSDSTGDFIFGKSISPQGLISTVQFPGNMGSPQFVSPTDSLGGSADGSSGSNPPGKIFGVTCPACGGTGLSPSSQGGNWSPDNKKKDLPKLIQSKMKSLADIERMMGIGGSEIIEITKHKVETIGTVMNDFGSIRVDMKGKMYVSDVQVGSYGTFYNRTPSPLVELVHVDDLPGGNYTLNVCNRYNVMVGSGGINLKSYGVINISGSMTNIAGEQVNISSELETNIDGGKRLSLVGDIISIRQRNKQQVVVEGSLGVTNNLVVAGGLHVEGELTANHITMPTEIQATEQTQSFGAAATDSANSNGKIIGFGVPLSMLPVPSGKKDLSFKESGGSSLTGPPYIGKTSLNEKIGTIPPGGIKVLVTVGLATYTGANTNIVDVFGTGTNCIKGSDAGAGGVTAGAMPIIVYGTGREADSILLEPHSHMFKGLPSSLTNTNSETREKVVGKDAPINAEVVANYKK
jgi:hypothetical protein